MTISPTHTPVVSRSTGRKHHQQWVLPPFSWLTAVTHPRTPGSRDALSNTFSSASSSLRHLRRSDPSLQSLPPTPLGSAQAPQSTYIQTLTRTQHIRSE